MFCGRRIYQKRKTKERETKEIIKYNTLIEKNN